MSGWARRLRRPQEGPHPLHEAQVAARNLAEHVAPGKAKVVFQVVADVALVGTVLVSGALAAVHLYKALFREHKEDPPAPHPESGGASPPRRRGPRTAVAQADRGRCEYEEDGHRSR